MTDQHEHHGCCSPHIIKTSCFDLGQRFIGTREIVGELHNPQILAMLKLDAQWPKDDETPWCSAFVNYIAWLLRLPRSKSLRARSWLLVGRPIGTHLAEPYNDVCIFARGEHRPLAHIIDAPGHVGFFSSLEGDDVLILGGNQGDEVSVRPYKLNRLLGVRRLK